MHLSTLSEWLTWISSIHFSEIDLGLERVALVANKLDLLPVSPVSVIVGGTNGKGSTVAAMEAIYQAAGFAVGSFTSPILYKHNEQVRINGKNPSDEIFCDAFEKIAEVRGDVLLTPFEYHLLAALTIFSTQALDVLLLEVGLGGRLDAVNIVDADVSVVTSIAIDHAEYLGDTREAIAYEKAGIFRSHHPAVCGDDNPPHTLLTQAQKLDAPLYVQGRDFFYQAGMRDWHWHSQQIAYTHLPLSTLALQNLSTALMAVTLLQTQLPVAQSAINNAFEKVNLPARVQVMIGDVTEIFDVAHNPAAVLYLAERLRAMPCAGKTRAVFSMLADKDIAGSLANITSLINHWYIASLDVPRAASRERLLQEFAQANVDDITLTNTIVDAYQLAREHSQPGDRIVVFGSFHTVGCIEQDRGNHQL